MRITLRHTLGEAQSLPGTCGERAGTQPLGIDIVTMVGHGLSGLLWSLPLRLVLTTLFFLTIACGAFATDIANIVGSAHWGGGYWFPTNSIWCLNGAQVTLFGSVPCNASGVSADELSDGANRLLALGTRVIYVPLNANPASFYWFENPTPITTIFTNTP